MHNIARSLTAIAIVTASLGGFDLAALAAGRDRAASGARQTLVHNGVERSYVVRLPPALVSSKVRVPLVLVLHGGGGNAANAESMTGFTDKAAKEGFIVVYPEGSSRFRDKLLTWNAGHCCGYAMDKRVDDVGFIRALVDKLVEVHPVDPKRVYATGMSNGGIMAHRLGIELSEKFAAIAPVVATLFGDERRPAHPVSAIMLNGMLDKSVPHQGGAGGGRFPDAWDGTPAKPAEEQATFWAGANGCTTKPDKLDRPAFTLVQYRCPTGKAVELYLIKDNGHAWPGGQKGTRRGDKPSSSVNGTDMIWEFFKAHTK